MAEEKSSFDKLSEKLYSRTRYKNPVDSRTRLESNEGPNINEKWQGPNLDEMMKHEQEEPVTHPIIKKFFIFALVFFSVAILVAGYVFFGGAGFVSSKNVDISVLGPTMVSAGEVFELGVTVKNKNNADLDLANLSIQYPQGARDPADTSKTINYTQDKLGEVKAGRESVQNIKAAFFGSPGEVKQIKFSVEYKVKGSNATFYKDKIYEVAIGESPLTFSVNSPTTINSGENFNTTIEVSLNSDEILKGVMVRAEYPYGYAVTSATPKAISGDNVWSLGDLNPGEKKTIVLKGQLIGENSEERTSRFFVGIADGGDNPNFKTIISSTQNTITIARPSINLGVTFNGESGNPFITSAGDSVNVSIRFENNLSDKLLNPKIEARITGVALNKFSIFAQTGGFYDSGNNKVVWNLVNGGGAPELAPGDDGRVFFSFSSIENPPISPNAKEIALEVVLSGTPINTPRGQPIVVTEKRTIKISSEINLSSEVLYSRGAFTNSGPIPPKADTETTYTINLRTVNTQAEVSGSVVTAKLGSNVSWLGASESSSETVIYDETNNIITWDIGTLASGTGSSKPERMASFQVALKPSISQIGIAPTLVSNIVLTGVDTFTSREITVYNPALTTKLSNDPVFVQGDEYVVK